MQVLPVPLSQCFHIFCVHLQVPISLSVSLYEAISLYKGRRVISSKGNQETTFQVHQLMFYCACGVLAGIVGGLLGLGGGFIMGPLFLELGVPPQVSPCFSSSYGKGSNGSPKIGAHQHHFSATFLLLNLLHHEKLPCLCRYINSRGLLMSLET